MSRHTHSICMLLRSFLSGAFASKGSLPEYTEKAFKLILLIFLAVQKYSL